MGYKTQADLDEALRTGTVADATVDGDAESKPLDSDPGSPGSEAGNLADVVDAILGVSTPPADLTDAATEAAPSESDEVA